MMRIRRDGLRVDSLRTRSCRDSMHPPVSATVYTTLINTINHMVKITVLICSGVPMVAIRSAQTRQSPNEGDRSRELVHEMQGPREVAQGPETRSKIGSV